MQVATVLRLLAFLMTSKSSLVTVIVRALLCRAADKPGQTNKRSHYVLGLTQQYQFVRSFVCLSVTKLVNTIYFDRNLSFGKDR